MNNLRDCLFDIHRMLRGKESYFRHIRTTGRQEHLWSNFNVNALIAAPQSPETPADIGGRPLSAGYDSGSWIP